MNISEFLKAELDKALDRQPDDDAKLVLLAKNYGSWCEMRRRFVLFGEQPFGGPHPHHGEMQAPDFVMVIGMIDAARARIERRCS